MDTKVKAQEEKNNTRSFAEVYCDPCPPATPITPTDPACFDMGCFDPNGPQDTITPTTIVDCDGSTSLIDTNGRLAQRVVLSGTESPIPVCIQGERDFAEVYLCDVNNGHTVLIRTVLDHDTNTFVTTYFDLVTGTDWSGNPATDLVQCADSELESDRIKGCDNGTPVSKWVVKKDGEPTGVVYYTDDITDAIVTPIAWLEGACSSSQYVPHVFGYIKKPGTCTTTQTITSFAGTDFVDITKTFDDGNGNYTLEQEMATPASATALFNIITLAETAGVRTEENIASGAFILNFWEANVTNATLITPTRIRYDAHTNASLGVPTPLNSPCVDPVSDVQYVNSVAFLDAQFAGWTLNNPNGNSGPDIEFIQTQYTATGSCIPVKQVLSETDGILTETYYAVGDINTVVPFDIGDEFVLSCETCKKEIIAVEQKFYVGTGAAPVNMVAYELTSNLASNGWNATNSYIHLVYGILLASSVNPPIGSDLQDYFATPHTGILFTDITTIQSMVDTVLPMIGLSVGDVIYAVNTANEPIWFLSPTAEAELLNSTYLHIYFGDSDVWNNYSQKADVTVIASNSTVLIGGTATCTPIQEIKERDTCTLAETYRYVIEDGAGNLVDATTVITGFDEANIKTECPVEPKLVNVPNCDGTSTTTEVDEVNAVYLMNQQHKHTERLYDNVTATLTGSFTTLITGTNIAFNLSTIVATNWVGANYLIDFGNGFTDVGGNPSFNYTNEPDGNYEIKVYRGFVFPEGIRWYLLAGVEITKTGSSITVASANPAPVNRSITYTQKEVLQDYCNGVLVGSPYLADSTPATINGTLSLTYREELTEWLDNTDANNGGLTIPETIKSGSVSIANGTFATNLGPDGATWNNPGNLKSVTILARKSNTSNAIPGAGGINQVLIQTTSNKAVLLTGESVTFSVEDGNIQDFVYVDTLENAAALVVYNYI